MRPQSLQAIEPSTFCAPDAAGDRSAFLTPPNAAEYLRSRYGQGTVKSLAKFRSFGGGPAFFRFGKRRILYREIDLDAWAATRINAIEGC